jgi:hypothetical protein
MRQQPYKIALFDFTADSCVAAPRTTSVLIPSMVFHAIGVKTLLDDGMPNDVEAGGRA